ncbi:unnamed protein product [Rotaria magnacalcarata]|uniref:Major facilitator superfamily (MFS) profile domain-containing protein n=1 Tax=Rotaria magnacalcarata TaxID=392030 RepID=A0A816V9K7_9BILA|nr:unnamed protein product [Rotaria magnacalcarata]CAF3802988.1 unnamed protein product [Rotaria magnacalcarata]
MSPKILIFLVIVLSGCLAGTSSEIYIPSLPAIADDLKITIDEAQYTIAIFMLGLSISQLIYGPISDVIGRRLPLIIGILIMIFSSFICFYTTNITTLLLGRFIQKLGAGAGASLWRAIFRDSFNGAELTKYGGYLSIIMPFIVPTSVIIGGYLQTYFGWRVSFLCLILYSLLTWLIVLFIFKETSTHHHKDRLSRKFFIETFGQLLSSRIFIGYTMCTFLSYGAFLAWFTISPVLLIKVVGISPIDFGWIISIGGGGTMILAGLFNGTMVAKLGSHFMLRIGWTLMLLAGCLMMMLKFIYGINALVVVAPMIIFYFGSTLIWPSVFACAFAPFGKIAGYVASLYSFMQLGGGAVISALASYLPDNNQIPLASILIGCSTLSLGIFEFMVLSKKNLQNDETTITTLERKR